MNVRFGMMVIGPTLTGKSTAIKTLKDGMNHIMNNGYEGTQYNRVECEILNPKSISMDELYGCFNVMTLVWTDGLASTLIGQFVEKDTPDMKWVVFDGPVDARWIENMNTVLDDTQTLCLSNGERLRLRNEMRMVFEVDDLSQASPATVSRCGMVYVDPKNLGYYPFYERWCKKKTENGGD